VADDELCYLCQVVGCLNGRMWWLMMGCGTCVQVVGCLNGRMWWPRTENEVMG
jgi:hypothetical protein